MLVEGELTTTVSNLSSGNYTMPYVVNTNCILVVDIMYIYDRWGNLLYVEESKILSEMTPWDGTYKGKTLNPGVYIYMINAIVEGEEMKFSGDVTITK